MAHARITLDYAVELITARIENGQGSPTDQEIADYCGLQQASDSRSLLADLSDAGKITIKGTGADRVITLGRRHSAPTPAPRPTPSVKSAAGSKRRLTLDETADRIKEILARGKAPAARVVKAPEISAPVAPPPAAPEPLVSSPRVYPLSGATKGRGVEHRGNAPAASQPDSPPAIPPGAGDEGARHCGPLSDDVAPQAIHVEPLPLEVIAQLSQKAQREISKANPPKPARAKRPAVEFPVPKLEIVRLPTKGSSRGKWKRPDAVADRVTRKQINIHVSAEVYAEIARRAALEGAPAGGHARTLLMRALSGTSVKPVVPAHITAAAQREGVPVVAFMADLLERGFASWQGEWSVERCA